MTKTWKRIVKACGALLAAAGVLLAFNLFCIASLAVLSGGSDMIWYGIASLTLAVLTLGAGVAVFWHADNSLRGKPSKTVHLPPLVAGMGIFLMLLMAGLGIRNVQILSGFLFPSILLILAALPPLWAVSWFTPHPSAPREEKSDVETPDETVGASTQTDINGLTWRRGLVAFCGGATVSVFLALILEILLPIVILALLFTSSRTLDSLNALFNDLLGSNAARALTDPAFVYIFIEVAVIAPLVEELVKPLVTLPLLRSLNRQETFWVGALAGAGFAAVENVIYAGGGLALWAGILVVRALGGALHPLGSGLTSLGWRDVLRGEPGAFAKWVKYYALAVLVHAAWNGGSLLVITLGSAQFFGRMPEEIGVLGLPMAGTTLAFLLILGMIALWIGRAYGHNRPLVAPSAPGADSLPGGDFALSERGMALWALACLLVFVPLGITGLKLWLR